VRTLSSCRTPVVCLPSWGLTRKSFQGEEKGGDTDKPEGGRSDKEGEEEGQKEDKDGAGVSDSCVSCSPCARIRAQELKCADK
jgi:hypothetical protein